MQKQHKVIARVADTDNSRCSDRDSGASWTNSSVHTASTSMITRLKNLHKLA